MKTDFLKAKTDFTALAKLYFPTHDAPLARVNLNRWIKHNKKLRVELEEAGFGPKQIRLTPRQFYLILKYFDMPVSLNDEMLKNWEEDVKRREKLNKLVDKSLGKRA